jgi:hypothetical protein
MAGSGTNLEAYCGNSPVENVDPSGLNVMSYCPQSSYSLGLGLDPANDTEIEADPTLVEQALANASEPSASQPFPGLPDFKTAGGKTGFQSAYFNYLETLSAADQSALSASDYYVAGCNYFDQPAIDQAIAAAAQEQAAWDQQRSARYREDYNAVMTEQNMAYNTAMATPWAGFCGGLNAGALTLGAALDQIIPFVDHSYDAQVLSTGWQESGIQGTGTAAATRIAAKVSAGATFAAAGGAALPLLPGGVTTVLGSAYVQAPLGVLAGYGAYENGVNAYNAYQAGDMAAFGDSTGNAIVFGAGALGSAISVGSDLLDVAAGAGSGIIDVAPSFIERGGPGMGYASQVLEGGSGYAVAGHGEYRLGSGDVVVPEGSSITPPALGTRISQATALYIETADWDGLAAAAQSNPRIASDIQGMRTYMPGETVPNYTLKAPNNLTVYSNSYTVEDATLLSDLFVSRPGQIDWAACTNAR